MTGSLAEAVGGTPLVPLRRIGAETGARILVKAEHMNPTGSVKDRIASFIIEQAERRGELRPGATILEVTSGNTGIAFAMIGAARGYRVVVMMPRSATPERRAMIERYGGVVEPLDDLLHLQDAVEKAVELAREDPNIFLPKQFSNPDNPRCHRETTGREILRQVDGPIHAFVMGIGTGGTLMGVGAALREQWPRVRVVAVEPAESAVLSGGPPGCHGIAGLADGFIPPIVDRAAIDEIEVVATEEAVEMARRLAREEGAFVGPSAGANVAAAVRVAARLGRCATVVTVFPDRGERYFSLWNAR